MSSASHLLSPAHCRPLRAQHIARHALLVSTTVTTSFVIGAELHLLPEWPLMLGLMAQVLLPIVPFVIEKLARRPRLQALAASRGGTPAAALVDDVVAAPWTPTSPGWHALRWRLFYVSVVITSIVVGSVMFLLGSALQLSPTFVLLFSATILAFISLPILWTTAAVHVLSSQAGPTMLLGLPVVTYYWCSRGVGVVALALSSPVYDCLGTRDPMREVAFEFTVLSVCLTLTLAIAVTCHNRWQRRQSTG